MSRLQVDSLETNLQAIGQVKTMMFKNDRRASGRKEMSVPGRIIWRDTRGTPRFSSVVTRDVSERAVYIECLSGPPIAMHRLVYLQLDRTLHACEILPAALRQGKVLSAVYRVGPVSNVTGLPDGYALRMLVAPPAQRASAVPGPAPFANEPLALPA